MKNFSDIQALLDRYWDGETTLEEERALKAYFASGDVDERLRSVAPLFQALRQEKSVQLKAIAQNPPVVRVRRFTWYAWAAAASVALLLSAGLWWWAQHETPVVEQMAQTPPVQPEQIVQPEDSVLQPILEENKLASAEKPPTPVFAKKTFAKRKKEPTAKPLDPETEQAMEEIKAALALVSSKISKGKREAAKGAVHLENVDKIFKKDIN